MGPTLSSHDEFEAWLEDKPHEWAQAISLRAALRLLPFTCDPACFNTGAVDPRLPLTVFRASSIAFGAGKVPHSDIAAAAAAAARDALDTATDATDGYVDNSPSLVAANVAALAAIASDNGDGVVYAAAKAASAAPFVAGQAAAAYATVGVIAAVAADVPAAIAAAADVATEVTRDTIFSDCMQLQQGISPAALLAHPLWDQPPDWFQEGWGRAAPFLTRPNHGFLVWREWYFSRLIGQPHAFNRFDSLADEAFYRWIVKQDDEWWKRKPAAVNADIAAMVEELRSAAPPAVEEFAQNPAVVNFALDGEGRTVVAPEPLPNGLQDDPDARDTHGEILRLIGDSRLSCDSGLTQATDMLGPVDLLAEATGQSVADLRPRLFVLRGKELIRQFEERQRADSMASPLSVGQTNCFAPLIAAIMQLADEDPKLRKLWQGPDGDAPPLSKVQITILVDALAAVGQTHPEAQQPLATAAGQVRPDAGPDDPARRTASEMLRNVFRSIGKRIKWADDNSQAAIGFLDRMQDLWERVRSVLPVDDLIARILDFFKGGGG